MIKQLLLFCVVLFTACAVKTNVENTEQFSVLKNESSSSVKKVDFNVSKIKPSLLLDKLAKEKSENPKISKDELVKFANELIHKYGVDFWVDVAGLIENKTEANEIEELIDDFEFNVRFSFTATLSNSKEKSFQIESPRDSCCCGYAYASFPVSNITSDKMTLIVDSKPFELNRNKDISFSQEHVLIENVLSPKKIRSWQIPFETYPFGISEDGMKLYVDYEETGLLLEIGEHGEIKFVSKDAQHIIKNGKDLRRFPEPKVGEILFKSGENGLMKFKSANRTFIVDFPYVCT
jgi:hypothetical protein